MNSLIRIFLAFFITFFSTSILSGCGGSSDSNNQPEDPDSPDIVSPPIDPPTETPTKTLSFSQGDDIALLDPRFTFNIDIFNVQQHILDNGYFAFTWVKSTGTYFYDENLTDAFVELKLSSPDGVTQYPESNPSGKGPETSANYQVNTLGNSILHFSFAQKSSSSSYLSQFQRDYSDLDDVILGKPAFLFSIPSFTGDTVMQSTTVFGGNRKIDTVSVKKQSGAIIERLYETVSGTDYFEQLDSTLAVSSIAANTSEQGMLVSQSWKSERDLSEDNLKGRVSFKGVTNPPHCCSKPAVLYIPAKSADAFSILEYRIADSTTLLSAADPVQLPLPELTYKFVQTKSLLADNGDIAISFYAYQFLSGTSGTNASYKVIPGIMSKTAGSDTFNYYTFDTFSQIVGQDGNGEVIMLEAPKMVEHDGKILMLLTNFHPELNEAMVASTDKLKLGIVNAAFGQAPGIKTLDTELDIANIFDELQFAASKSLTSPALITALYRNDTSNSDSSDTATPSEILGFSIDKDYAPQAAEVIKSYSAEVMWEMNLSFSDKGTPETDDDFYLLSWLTKTKDETLTQFTDEFRKFRYNLWFNTLDVEPTTE